MHGLFQTDPTKQRRFAHPGVVPLREYHKGLSHRTRAFIHTPPSTLHRCLGHRGVIKKHNSVDATSTSEEGVGRVKQLQRLRHPLQCMRGAKQFAVPIYRTEVAGLDMFRHRVVVQPNHCWKKHTIWSLGRTGLDMLSTCGQRPWAVESRKRVFDTTTAMFWAPSFACRYAQNT